MKRLIVVLALFSLALLASAQDSGVSVQMGAADSANNPKRAKVLEMIQLLHVDTLAIEGMKRQLASTKKLLPVPPKAQDDFEAMFLKEITPEIMRDLMIPIYESNFSLDELSQIVAFYKTPIGQKLISKLPEITQQGYAAGAAKGREAGERIGRIIEERLRAGEYGPWTPPNQNQQTQPTPPKQ
jgi:hypothetical protein